MKEIVPTPPAIVHNEQQAVIGLFQKYVVPSYGRFELVLARGQGSHLWDVNGKRYLDLGGGIAVCSLGHANAEITEALVEQSRRMMHISNLYYHEPQGRLAQQVVRHLAPGKVFFSNSGAEANEGLYKLARKFGHDEGRYEIITALNSFHGRTLAGIAATGQEKVKKGFEPAVPGFKHVPYNDLQAVRDAITPATAAILIEGVQGEGGIAPASQEYLLSLRQLCDERRMLLLMDGVQCGHFRTGRFQSFQRILEPASHTQHTARSTENSQSLVTSAPTGFLPDGVSMAKSLGGGFPIGAFWVREEHHGVKLCDLLGPGTHATTYGGTPLGCAVANKVFEVIERDRLADNARETGAWMKAELENLAGQFPQVIRSVRGLGFMLGIELSENIPAFANTGKVASLNFVNRLHEIGVLTVPSGTHVVRFLPALNLSRADAAEGVDLIGKVVRAIA